MRDQGQVRLIKLGVTEDDWGVVTDEDYRACVASAVGDSSLGQKVMGSLLEHYRDASVSKEQLVSELKLSKEEISYVLVGQTSNSFSG